MSISNLIFEWNFGCWCRCSSSIIFIFWLTYWNIVAALRYHSGQYLPEYLWTFQSQGSAGIAWAKRIRRTPPGVLAWVNPLSKIKAKTFLSRNLAFLLAARRPPHSTIHWGDRLLFCLLFFDRFLEGIFLNFAHFWPPLGIPKIIKNRQKSVSGGLLFRILCLSYTFSRF